MLKFIFFLTLIICAFGKMTFQEYSEDKDSINVELKKFYEHEPLCKENLMKYDNLLKTIDNYVQRYVNLFLITSNLRDHEVKDLNEIIRLDLEISITGEDLNYLQGYSKNSPVYPKNFSKLDAIFYKIAKQKERSYLDIKLRQSQSFFERFNTFSINNPVFYNFFRFFMALLMTWLIFQFLKKKKIFIFVGVMLNSFLLWDSFNLYHKKLKEVDAEIYIKMLELKNAPEKCDPANIGWYDTFLNYFRGNKCLEYYKTLNKHAVEEVSMLDCIINTYSFHLIQSPFRILGASLQDFTGGVTNKWPWPFNYLSNVLLLPIFTVIIFIFIFAFYSKRLKLSGFGATVEVGGGEPVILSEKLALPSKETPRTIRIVRKLRPWTKSRVSKRLELELGKRRKPFLKPSKSLSEIPDETYSDFSDSNRELTVHHMKDD